MYRHGIEKLPDKNERIAMGYQRVIDKESAEKESLAVLGNGGSRTEEKKVWALHLLRCRS